MTPSAVAKLVAEWRDAACSNDCEHDHCVACRVHAKELEQALATAPPEQAAWRIKCPNCGVTQSHDCKTLGERMGIGAPACLLQKIENILGRCVFDQSDSLTYNEGVAMVKALPELADPPQPASDGALDAEIKELLEEIAAGKGPYKLDNYDFACSVIETAKGNAKKVLAALASHDQKVREPLATWMIANSFATGHGDTVEDLLKELKWQIEERDQKVRREVLTEIFGHHRLVWKADKRWACVCGFDIGDVREDNREWVGERAFVLWSQHIRSLAAPAAPPRDEGGVNET